MKHISFKVLIALLFLFAAYSVGYAAPGTGRTVTLKKGRPALQKGAEYSVNDQKRTPLFFSRTYSKSGKNVFVTTYAVYDAAQKTKLYTVTAVHNKIKKTVEVSVKDMKQRGTPVVNVEHADYITPFMGRFGAIGKVGVIGNSKTRTTATAPSQLTVKFTTRRYDYIKVLEISGNRESSKQDLSVYLLDQ